MRIRKIENRKKKLETGNWKQEIGNGEIGKYLPIRKAQCFSLIVK